MAIIHLVRHAQASFGQANYDQLSELGRQQARWLGEHYAARDLRFARALAGTLVRQRDTALEMLDVLGADPAMLGTAAGLDEYPGEALYAAFTGGADARAHQRRDYRDYWRTVRQAMIAWSEDRLADMPLSWAQFGQGIRDALLAAADGLARDQAALVVSSGGTICRLLADLLGSPAAVAVELNLQYRNTACCEILATSGGLRVISFNGVPHLDHPARRSAITFA